MVDDLTHKVGKYHPIYIKTLDKFQSLARSTSSAGRYLSSTINTKTIYELAEWYAFDVLKIKKESFRVNTFSVADVVNRYTAYMPHEASGASKKDELLALLKANLDASVFEKTV
jgi:hypothetical protein